MMALKTKPGMVSVILINYKGVEDTKQAIESLFKLDWPDHLLEIIVVDNNSQDDSVQLLKKFSPKIKVVASDSNLGFAAGCNLGVSKSKGEFIGFLNNDARVDPDWIKKAIDTFSSGLEIGAVASKVLDWGGTHIDYVDGAITWTGMGYKPGVTQLDNGQWDQPKDVLFGTGAAMFVRANVFAELGGFDEDFFMFFEDVDLGWRLNLAGYRFRYQPDSIAFHKHHSSMNKLGSFKETYLLERNALFMLYKNLDQSSFDEVFGSSVLLAVKRAIARGELDSSALDITKNSNDNELDISISKTTAAGFFAIDQFIEKLPQLSLKREAIQNSRLKTDDELKRLFGNTEQMVDLSPSYVLAYENIVSAFGLWSQSRKRKVLIVTGDAIGPRMAGPAIRAWQIAQTLSDENEVRILSTNKAVPLDDRIDVGVISIHQPQSVEEHEAWADIIIVQGYPLWFFPALEKTNKILVVDVYDPMHLEQLEQARGKTVDAWNTQILGAAEVLNHQLLLGDFFLCASERQRHFWLGQLAGLGRINAHTYTQDSELDSLIAVAPFGIPEEPPVQTKHGIRGVVPGISESDKVIVWAGGIYNWFDPATLIRAVAQLAKKHQNVKLFFMGVKHPNPDVPEMEAVSASRILSNQLGLTGKHVFFNEDWVPYEERQNYLLDADVGVSTHFQHVETVFSFRTRILDYLWANLPIVTTGGDPFGDLVEKESLGAVVEEKDVEGLSAALENLLYNEKNLTHARANVTRIRPSFYWANTLKPLVEFCRNPIKAADHTAVRGEVGTDSIISRPKPGSKRTRARKPTGAIQDLRSVIHVIKNEGLAEVFVKIKGRKARKNGKLN